MGTTIVTRISIAAKPADVFEYLANLKYHHLWNPHIYSISSLDRLHLGSTYDTESHLLGITLQANNVVTIFIPSQELALENNIGTLKHRASYRLVPKGKGTTVICSTTVYSDSKAVMFTLPVLKRLARRELQTDMQALKIAVEDRLE